MPQLDAHTYASQLFWLIVTFVPLYLILWKVALPRVVSTLESRRSHIDHDLERAAALKDEADQALAAYESALAEARTQAQQALREAAEAAAKQAAARHAELGARLEADLEAAEARIAQARDAAMGQVKDVARELAGLAVERLGAEKPAGSVVSSAVDGALRERA